MKRQATTALLLAALTGCAIAPAVPAEGTLERAKYDQRRALTKACMLNAHKQNSAVPDRQFVQADGLPIQVATRCRQLARKAVQ